MRKCKNCEELIPYRKWINGRYHNLNKRVFCLKCSPFKQHNTKQYINNKGMLKTCIACNKEYVYDRNNGHRLTMCSGCKTRKFRLKRKKDMVQYKGGKCIMCGYDKCLRALTFHHRESSDKVFDLSTNCMMPWNKVLEELEKCDLLCHNCHDEVEDEIYISKHNINTE